MQSGITASPALHEAFATFTTTPSQRALLAAIKGESILPTTTLPSTPSFAADLSSLAALLSLDSCAYLFIRPADPSSGLVAITFVPDAAPVRQKMLTAASRLSLVRDLGGAERLPDSRVCTRIDEVATAEGWAAHAAHEAGAAPLTDEERGARELRDVEAVDVGGTGRRGAGYGPRVAPRGGASMPADPAVVDALRGLKEEGALVMLALGEGERFVLVSAEAGVAAGELGGKIDAAAPRYSLYGYAYGGEQKVLFVYTCPSAAKVRDRMLYASCRRSAEVLAEADAGLVLAKKIEVTDPSDITEESLLAEFAPREEKKIGFAKPKRPGRR